ncbi:hypothetical protein [Aneurinibacillus aneurinilyticus]|jgi:hypothetical protein|uniref:Uncharacterized protein n=2 Tax=Aneurinibacillus aneurinilyticus TaxID=1391 RepID=A0A848CU28_ANEAE|nr:hypothetical protein [Aneurinibacillus aneurinilyticus]ERI07673.1 hypothetical protein HMPREF0083_04213 [Aneurinibacillus aneurinilyticus ATCC 12856]MCI1694520.1 hypothetical protein [Aneurinibacillus aneurinilyticus]MED0670885.1 hypothetical protein [Aneurinibacillus aneurinilyticus]MED0705595.1 hypothetical protein [Aneurinibacillus aneurinilyticus]MED0724486.1 hypothetical protein [Aneurinibacillus aneurinilyticus]
MILTLTLILFLVYVGIRIWIFGRQKEWRELVVFTAISGLACYFLFVSNILRKSGVLLHGLQQITGPFARMMIATIFGVEL